jgi:hypothetical protein
VKRLARVGNRDIVDTVFDLASVAVVLTFNSCGVIAAFCDSGLIDTANRHRVGMFGGDDSLASIAKLLLVPHD